jgi:hypothetical protein
VRLCIEAVPIERAVSDVLVATFFEDDRPLRGGAGRADWRLCGTLSRLLEAGRLRGSAGDAALVGTGSAFASPRLLLLGLGPTVHLERSALRRVADDALSRATGLGFPLVGISLPLCGRPGELPLDASAAAFVEAALAPEPPLAGLSLLVPPGTEPGIESLARRLAQRLGRRDLDVSVAAARPSGPEPRAAQPAQ